MPLQLVISMQFLRTVVIVAVIAPLLPLVSASTAEPPAKPNVLFMVADDLNTDLACYGHAIVKTPQLDALAKTGVLFSRAYCQNPVCNPSRTSFLSGLRPGTKVKEDATFLPEFFSGHGYHTVEMGKVTHSYGVTATAIEWDVEEKRPTPAALAAAIKRASDSNVPWFVAVGLAHTHPGFSFERKLLDHYKAEKLPVPDEPDDFRTTVPDEAYDGINIQQLSDAERQDHLARYYAAITSLDAQIGELLGVLDKSTRDNTIVVFTSDHGRHLGEHGGIYDKRTLFEASARVPLLILAPGFATGETSPRLVELVDLFPTLAELCNLTTPKQLQGTSLVPLLKDPQRAWKKGAFTSAHPGKLWGHAVRTEQFRYAQWRDGEAAFLFDYHADPGETKNLIGDARHAKTVAQMKQLLDAGWADAGP